MKKIFISIVLTLATSLSLAAGQFTLKDATDVAVNYMRSNPGYGLVKGDSVRLGKRDSNELTREYMTQQISYMGPSHKWSKKYSGFMAEMNQNPTLQIFYMSLRTGSGASLSQTEFYVRLGLINDKVAMGVTPESVYVY